MKYKFLFLVAGALTIGTVGCKDDEEPPVAEPQTINTIPGFYLPTTDAASYGTSEPVLVMMADGSDQIDEPWDLDFHPSRENELWVINKGTENQGGSSVTISNAGLENQSSEWRRDGNAWHFMAHPTALSFSKDNDNWGSTPEILDANRMGGRFTGPTLWSSDMSVYARPSGGNGSHLDMLHESPYAMGIEWDKGNAFWVYDGYHKDICWYDFVDDHGPGASYHGDALIRRYPEVVVKRLPDVASHMVLDHETGWLYIADAGNARILKMNTKTGTKSKNITQMLEPVAEYSEMTGVDWKIFASTNLQEPSGMELSNGVLYVTDHKTGEIIAYGVDTGYELGRFNTGLTGIMGIKADSEGKLWFVSTDTDEIYKVEPQ